MNPFRMRQRNSSLMTTGFGRQCGHTPGSLMKHDFKDAWNEVSGWRRKHRAAHRDEIFTGVLGYDVCSKNRTADNAIIKLRQKLAGDLANPAHSTFQQVQNER